MHAEAFAALVSIEIVPIEVSTPRPASSTHAHGRTLSFFLMPSRPAVHGHALKVMACARRHPPRQGASSGTLNPLLASAKLGVNPGPIHAPIAALLTCRLLPLTSCRAN